jgi:hypothetical protein
LIALLAWIQLLLLAHQRVSHQLQQSASLLLWALLLVLLQALLCWHLQQQGSHPRAVPVGA